MQHMSGRKTVGDHQAEFGDAARARMRPAFEAAGVAYPPNAVVLVAYKDVHTLTLHGADASGVQRVIATYPVLGLSGELGPKLREGDRQVPEGVYRIEGVNPNSNYHVSLRLNYPNNFDLQKAAADGRRDAGSDIYIHGGTASVGCLAMGDTAIEELFILALDCGIEKFRVIIAPCDLRLNQPQVAGAPAWLPELYRQLQAAMKGL
ncbi:MAG: L,D-transpeptidase family protein [Candidatus Hydrogenedentes bacterium]|nr:L,D-transpeptidase family protein [Candidatus Hydrogenedentota bacterium]